MKVKFVNPNNKKFGSTEHIENTTGRTLIALGECEEVPAIRRGEKGWLEERNAQAALVTGPSEWDTPAFTPGISWGVLRLKTGANIIKTVDGATLYFDVPPADCPASVCQQFLDVLGANAEVNAVAIAAAKQAQLERDIADKAAGNLSVRVAMFGSKRL
jgi:hypothetical protein